MKDYVEARVKYLTLYNIDETDNDTRVSEQHGRHIAKQIKDSITAEKRVIAVQKRQDKENSKLQRAIQLKSQRELKVRLRADKKLIKNKEKNVFKGIKSLSNFNLNLDDLDDEAGSEIIEVNYASYICYTLND